ncbi:hypothetical protein TSUD_113360 [Trifolium subterraneum]|uniref:Uncharacterized protein n=1 Tax=Trifolium subterraneum TaxID=3900 RepID=A0A2Z6LG24_TRISU|nr:hypothetical protein TSUD_113360 [Trifolium subterraneum]
MEITRNVYCGIHIHKTGGTFRVTLIEHLDCLCAIFRRNLESQSWKLLSDEAKDTLTMDAAKEDKAPITVHEERLAAMHDINAL